MQHTHKQSEVLEVSLKDCYDASELAGLEEYFNRLPGVSAVHLDRTRAVAHLSYDPDQTNPAALHQEIQRAGYGCTESKHDQSCCQPGHPKVSSNDVPHDHSQHVHAADPVADPHQSHAHPNPTPAGTVDHAAMGHVTGQAAVHAEHPVEHQGHDEHAGHGTPDDMLRRFIISALFTLPVVIFSPLGAIFGFPAMPPFGISMAL